MEKKGKRNFKTSPVRRKRADYEFSCSPCSDEGTHKEAVFKCINCQTYFCQCCVLLHNRILKSHDLIGKSEMKREILNAKAPVLPSVTCEVHPAEVLKMFCAEHDLVCCTVCVAIDHRSCDGIHYIPNIAKGINQSQDKSDTLKSIANTEEKLQQVISEKRGVLTQLNKQKGDIMQTINDTNSRLKAHLEHLEKATSEQVETEFKKIEHEIKKDITSLETTFNSVKMQRNRIKEFVSESEPQLFLQIKLGQKESNRCMQQITKMREQKAGHLGFEINLDIESYLKDVKSYGHLCGNDRKTKADLLGEYSVVLESETKNVPNFYGVCLMGNNEIILADNSNLKLKRLDTEYKITDWCDLGATPYGLCRTGHSEVAVSLPWLHKIQFISIGRKMVLTWAFKVDEICRGLCFRNGNLFICCGGSGSEDPGHVIVADMSGCLLRTFQTNQTGETLFSCPQNICLSDSELYIADQDKGVIALNKEGHFLSDISDQRLTHTSDVCLGDHGELLICGNDSNNVVLFDRHSNAVQEILCHFENIGKPTTITYLRNPSRILITCEGSGTIKVFKLELI